MNLVLSPESPGCHQPDDDFENAPVGLLSLNGQLGVRRINETLLAWLGRDRSELTFFERDGQVDFAALAGVLDERWREKLRSHVTSLKHGGNTARLELSVFGKDGRFFKIELASTGVFDEAGELLHTSTCVTDVSERNEKEHRLRSRLEMLQTLTDRTPSQLAYYDTNLVCQFSNAAHATSCGRTPGELVGLHLSDIVSPAVLPEIVPKVAKVLSGQAQQFEAQRLSASGEARFFDIRYIPDSVDGRVVGYFVEMVDITERRQTEDFVFNANLDLEERIAERTAELYRSEQRYRLMSEAIREYGIAFLDLEGNVQEWTDSAQRLHGFDRLQIVGASLGALLVGDAEDASSVTTAEADELLARCLSDGHSDRAGWCARLDGSSFWGRVTLTALRDPDETLHGISVVIRDLTEAKRLADLSRDTQKELTETVKEQSSELAKVNKDLEVFSYTVAHDLRAPIRHITQLLQLTTEQLEEPETHPAAPLLGRIDTATKRIGAMIDGLLEYTRIGQVQITKQPIPLGALVQGITGHLRASQGDRRIDWGVDPALPAVLGDPVLLGEALGKLIDNAVKFTRRTPDTRIEIGIRSLNQNEGVFYVKDNGVGFDLNKAKNLFLMFQRQHHSLDYEGVGTGLALAQRIVERHGGRIWCETSPGEGCCFLFQLPLAEPVAVRTDLEL